MDAQPASTDPARGANDGRARTRISRAIFALAACLLLVSACDDDTPAPLPPSATPITIQTADGISLDGRLFASRSPHLIVFLHEYRGDQSDWYGLARSFANGGRAATLTVDFRGYGLSEGERTTDEMLVTDVRAAVAHGRTLGYRSIVLIGASMGGTAAIIAASADPEIEGVIALSPPARFDALDAIAAIRERKPLFAVIAARNDESAVDSMRMLAEAAGLIPRYRVEVGGEAHGTALLTSTAGTDVRRRIDAMLTEIWDAP
ncbi:MAG: alpha/beta hydrolase [Dehalococcoidia bacterium]